MQVVIGPEIIKSYKRLSYMPWHAFAEFVDNSTQSFIDNQDELTGDGQENEPPLRIDIAYNRAGSGSITVSDNAMGMSSAELASALHIGRPPIDMTGAVGIWDGVENCGMLVRQSVVGEYDKIGRKRRPRNPI